MLLTRECDYAFRIIRALAGGEIVNVQDISEREEITVSIAYKLARKLEKAGYIRSYRGSNGGYALNTDLGKLTLYDICLAVEKQIFVCNCADENFVCTRNKEEHPCKVHIEICRIQKLVVQELKAKSILEIMSQ